VAAWAGAAAALVALGVGISRLDLTTHSSSSSSVATPSHAAAAGVAPNESVAPAPQTFTVSRNAAAHILGGYLHGGGTKERATSSGAAQTPLKVTVPAAKFAPLSARLRAAERQLAASTASGSSSTAPNGVVIIRLMRAHAP
jgi:hypothetical protein